ncbi:HalOD1 output domain-containing protein [Salinibaculum salinum]|uniref:HalOD1 output domain-containing protein n=1 Tax=Salinibaculum salinum TaxID=3131996 RepID=UPI0030EE0213
MSEEDSIDDETADTDSATGAVYAEIAPDPSTAEYDLLERIAELGGTDIEELPSLYMEVDHFVESLFEVPPSPAAQMEIRFSYAGYRITIAQSGTVKLVPVKETLGE